LDGFGGYSANQDVPAVTLIPHAKVVVSVQLYHVKGDSRSATMGDSSGSPLGAGNSSGERRLVPRYALIAQAEILEPASGTSIAGRVSEMSVKGCYVDLLNTLPVGTAVEVRVTRDQGKFMSRGRVIYAQDGMGMGIRFADLAVDQLKILESWLEESAVLP
jgi:hypothetical protein